MPETLAQVREIDKVLRSMDDVQDVDEGLLGMLVERIKVMNLVQVEFVLRAGVGVVEILRRVLEEVLIFIAGKGK